MNPTKRCDKPDCRLMNPSVARFCGGCGQSLTARPRTRRPRGRRAAIDIMLLVVWFGFSGMAVAALPVWFGLGDQPEIAATPDLDPVQARVEIDPELEMEMDTTADPEVFVEEPTRQVVFQKLPSIRPELSTPLVREVLPREHRPELVRPFDIRRVNHSPLTMLDDVLHDPNGVRRLIQEIEAGRGLTIEPAMP